MIEKSGENIPDEPQRPRSDGARKDGNVEGIVNELRNVLSELGNAVPREDAPPEVPEENPFAAPPRPAVPDLSLFRSAPPPENPAPKKKPLPEPAPEPLSSQPSDAEFWKGNVLGWDPGSEPRDVRADLEAKARGEAPAPTPAESEPLETPNEPVEANSPDFGSWGRPEDDVPPEITRYQAPDPEPPPLVIEPSSARSAEPPLDRKKSADPFREMGPDALFGRPAPEPAPPPLDVTRPPSSATTQHPFDPAIPEFPEAPPAGAAAPPEKKSLGDIFTRASFDASPVDLKAPAPSAPSSFDDLVVPIPGTLDRKPLEGNGLELDSKAADAELFRQFACIFPQGQEADGQKFVTKLKEASQKAKRPMNIQPVFVNPWSVDALDFNAWSKSAKLSGADIIFILTDKAEKNLFSELDAAARRQGMTSRLIDRRYLGTRTLYADIALQLMRKT